MYLYIIFLSLFNSILIGLLGNYIGRQAVIFISIIIITISFLCSCIILYEILLSHNIITIDLYNLFIIYDIKINIGFLFDQLTVIMLFIILSISLFVHIFTAGYMSHEPYIVRFYNFLGFFTFFMIVLVTADNFLQLFIGWEGVGLCSYLLINFWYNRVDANKAAVKAMLMNRIADVFFIFAIILLLYYFKTLNYALIFSLINYIQDYTICIILYNIKVIDLILLLLLIGAIGKSAQLGLHTWLPDAMEGPTPVSSLLHAATMVTAGVFLLIRCSIIFEKSNFILFLICLIGSLTALFTAIVANCQYDIKKVIAYSTCSQLGYMFIAIGLSNYNVTLFHLFNHAFFKALLFLGAGSVISSLLDEQDMRRMGYLFVKLPFTYISILIGSMAILGLPFLTGFYSKDFLLEGVFVSYAVDSLYIYIIGIFTAFLTAMYTFKLLFFIFIIKTNIYNKYVLLQEVNHFILISLFILSILSIFIGYFFFEIFIGFGSNYLNDVIYIKFEKFNNIEIEFISPLIKNMPLILTFLGVLSSYLLFFFINIKRKYILKVMFILKKWTYKFFFNAGFFNYFYNKIYLYLFYYFYKFNVKIIEKGFFEFYGPVGFYMFFRDLSYKIRFLSSFNISVTLLLLYINIIIISYFIIMLNILWIKSVYLLLFLYYILNNKQYIKKNEF